MKEIKGDLVLKKNTEFSESIKVEGHIKGRFSLKVAGNIDAGDINAGDIDAWNIDAWNINAGNINAWNIDAWNINAWNIDARNINARNISFFAFMIVRISLKCKSWKGRRINYIAKCLDNEIEIKENKVCSKCGK